MSFFEQETEDNEPQPLNLSGMGDDQRRFLMDMILAEYGIDKLVMQPETREEIEDFILHELAGIDVTLVLEVDGREVTIRTVADLSLLKNSKRIQVAHVDHRGDDAHGPAHEYDHDVEGAHAPRIALADEDLVGSLDTDHMAEERRRRAAVRQLGLGDAQDH